MPDRVTIADFLWGRAEFWPPGARWRGALWLLIIFGTYLAAIKLYPWSSGVAVVWVPNAILVTALLYFRPRDWAYVCAPGLPAEVVGDLLFNYAPTKSLALGVVNATEALLVVLMAAYIAGGAAKHRTAVGARHPRPGCRLGHGSGVDRSARCVRPYGLDIRRRMLHAMADMVVRRQYGIAGWHSHRLAAA